MRSPFSEWCAAAVFLVSWALLVMTVVLAKTFVDPSIICVLASFWPLLFTCAVALLRLVASKKDEEK